ncbi:MAG: AMP-binding protein [Allosphingosinicella sp.]|uniref:AMP-binding protein n=1 Tax=Allosphingosinicella sp. TaxID=2823234 RepID=UPI00394AE7A1
MEASGPRNLVELYRGYAERNSGKPAVSCVLPNGMSATLSYDELEDAADAVAAFLREELKLPPRSVIAVQAPNCLAFPAISKGVVKAGMVPTGINPLYTVREVADQIEMSGAKVLFVLDALAGELEAVVARTGPIEVVTLSVGDLFPALKARLIDFMLRRVKKMVPATRVPHRRFRDVLKTGRRHARRVGRGIDAYSAGIGPDDLVGLSFTGGTTGRSKGVMQMHGAMVSSIDQLVEHLGGPWRAGNEMRTLLVLPFYHVFGMGMMLQAAAQGGHIILIPNPRPLTNLKPAFEKFRPTFLPGVPTLFANLMNEEWFLPFARDLKLCLSGAAPLAPATQRRWRELTGVPIHELYGMTECGLATCTPLDGGDYTGTIGKPLPSIDIRVVDEDGNDVPDGEPGELLLKGPQLMKGYLDMPEETEKALAGGWLHTGDIVVKEPGGVLRIVDRAKDMVIVSGFNVYPSEVEAVITSHPKVVECAAIGIPCPEAGERVKAFVVAGDAGLTEEELRAHCREQLTAYKVPKQFELVADLPKSPVGKILRRELREKVESV